MSKKSIRNEVSFVYRSLDQAARHETSPDGYRPTYWSNNDTRVSCANKPADGYPRSRAVGRTGTQTLREYCTMRNSIWSVGIPREPRRDVSATRLRKKAPRTKSHWRRRDAKRSDLRDFISWRKRNAKMSPLNDRSAPLVRDNNKIAAPLRVEFEFIASFSLIKFKNLKIK